MDDFRGETFVNSTCTSCGKEYIQYQADKDKCFYCQLSEHKGFDKVTKDIMEKNPLPNFFIIKKE